jgi:DNA polymerase elongation subunit (family B)
LSDFYTNIRVSGKFILFRGVESGKRVQRKVEYRPTFFLPSREKTEFKTLAGEYVKPIQPGTIPECREFLQRYESVDNFPVYGNNRYEYAFIGDKYPDDILWDINKALIAYLDIEVGSENGFPEPKDANESITAITIKVKGNYFVFGCGDYVKHRDDVHYARCRDEHDLIRRFLDLWTRFHPDIVTGWNIEGFDIPYLVNRIIKILGEDEAKKLSPWNKLNAYQAMMFNKETQSYEILGVSVLDYIWLYRKFTYSQQESYRLDNIAHVELGEKKLDYSQFENLHQLYKQDYQKFIEYNIKDVELVEKLEDKMKLLELAMTLAYDNHVNYEDVFTQVRMWDSIVYNHLKKKNIVIPQMKSSLKSCAYEGAYVKDPILGMHQWVASFDLNSLYPHLIMQYNISMETIIEPSKYNDNMRGFIRNNKIEVDTLLNQQIDTSVLKEIGATVTPNGQLFSTKFQGMMPEIMDSMYKDRTRYKKLAIEAKKKMETVLEDKNQVEYLEKQVARYNNLQLAKKVTLNSAYGALGNQYFRFFDTRIAEGITTAGQLSIRWIEKKINEYMNKVLKTKGEDYVIASDTDSIYLNLGPLVDKVYNSELENLSNDPKKVIKFMNKICEEKIQPYIDNSYQELADYVNAYQQRMEMKRESLANKAIWTAKKRYILNVYDSEGVAYAKPKLKIMGLEAVKSSTPSACRTKIKEAINIIMTQTEDDLHRFINNFREEFKTLPVEDISFPRSVNGLKEYADAANVFKKGTPIHVKGALTYNYFLEAKKLTKRYQLIQEGEKIKFIYLKQPNIFNNNTLAFLSGIPKQLGAEQYIDYDLQFEKSFLEPLDIILSSINWNAEKVDSIDSFFT